MDYRRPEGIEDIAMPLILLEQDPTSVRTIAQLKRCVLEHITPFSHTRMLTTVFGPITENEHTTFDENMHALRRANTQLSEAGWHVLCLPTLQPTIDRILAEMDITGYPHILLDDLTLPLIEAGVFSVLHFRRCYECSRGAKMEYERALMHHEPWKVRFVD